MPSWWLVDRGQRAGCQDPQPHLPGDLRCLLGLGALIESVILPALALKREVPLGPGLAPQLTPPPGPHLSNLEPHPTPRPTGEEDRLGAGGWVLGRACPFKQFSILPHFIPS